MKIIKETTIEDFKVTIYHWNNKFLLKFEDGWHEITYKISELDLNNEKDIDLFLTDKDILLKVKNTFQKIEETTSTFFNKI